MRGHEYGKYFNGAVIDPNICPVSSGDEPHTLLDNPIDDNKFSIHDVRCIWCRYRFIHNEYYL